MIRPELQPPRRDKKTVDRLANLAEQVVDAVDSGMPYDQLVVQFNAATDHSFTVGDFMGAASSTTMREFARGALMPEPRRVEGVTKEDLLEIIRHVRGESTEGLLPESDLSYYVGFLAANIPNPRISDLIFQSDHLHTAEQVLEEAQRYRPFAMPPPQ